ncbi:type II toxin-antitoxin system PemK/MazF family toxin [Planobispora siamensis]|uniref:PemK-like, MazF-like toxin of type II toxin-antitoxin system n=1 Tax=Planobispora siamensis TaxID=936338 RepID=A0A8J3WMJ2_9ACTN|nr:type II toxin-antitoxin system PemK/MazF family toxin [Planobispora siamensis]GIH93527.1 hypothetical protein Psi01_41570 [Planobispora siamensis]
MLHYRFEGWYQESYSGDGFEVILGLLKVFGFWAFVFGLIAFLAWAVRRLRQSRPSIHPEPPDPSWYSRPSPGQIWWAAVPFADGSGSKVRPCLVVRTHAHGVEVLKITSQDKSHRYDCMQIPTARWDRRARKDSWLDLSRTHFLSDDAFNRLAARDCDGGTWSEVTRRHGTGWVYLPERVR